MKRQAKRCGECGIELPSDALFCHVCGAAAPVNAASHNRRTVLIAVATGVACLLVGAGASYFAYQAGLQSGYALGEKDAMEKGGQVEYQRGYQNGYSSGEASTYTKPVDYSRLAISEGPMIGAPNFTLISPKRGKWYLIKFEKNANEDQAKLAPLVVSAMSIDPIGRSSLPGFEYWNWSR